MLIDFGVVSIYGHKLIDPSKFVHGKVKQFTWEKNAKVPRNFSV